MPSSRGSYKDADIIPAEREGIAEYPSNRSVDPEGGDPDGDFLVDRPGSIDAVERQLLDSGMVVRRLDFSLSVSGATDDELFDAVVGAVASAGARVKTLGRRRRTLDDVFTSDIVAAGQPGGAS